jgi:hypothetical protein
LAAGISQRLLSHGWDMNMDNWHVRTNGGFGVRINLGGGRCSVFLANMIKCGSFRRPLICCLTEGLEGS